MVSGGGGRFRRRQQVLHGGDEVAHGAHALEAVHLDAPAGHFLQLDREIHGIDAVEIEVFEKVRIRRDAGGIDFEGLHEDVADFVQDVLGIHGAWSEKGDGETGQANWRRDSISSARLLTELKCRRFSASPASSWIW